MEKLNNGRAKIRTEGNETSLVIPVKRNYLIIIFSTVWLLIWFSFIDAFSSNFGFFTDEGIDRFFFALAIILVFRRFVCVFVATMEFIWQRENPY